MSCLFYYLSVHHGSWRTITACQSTFWRHLINHYYCIVHSHSNIIHNTSAHLFCSLRSKPCDSITSSIITSQTNIIQNSVAHLLCSLRLGRTKYLKMVILFCSQLRWCDQNRSRRNTSSGFDSFARISSQKTEKHRVPLFCGRKKVPAELVGARVEMD